MTPVVKDTASITELPKDTAGIGAIFKDTAPTNVFAAEGRTFNPQIAGQRAAFLTMLRKERDLWQARKVRDYRFLLRVGCFCPGTRGWLLIEVRNGKAVRATDHAGKPVGLTDWNTFSIDELYDNLARSTDNSGQIRIAFDSRWHFPSYVRTISLPGPDAWSIIELRALRPA